MKFNAMDFLWWALIITLFDLCWEICKAIALTGWWILTIGYDTAMDIWRESRSKHSE